MSPAPTMVLNEGMSSAAFDHGLVAADHHQPHGAAERAPAPGEDIRRQGHRSARRASGRTADSAGEGHRDLLRVPPGVLARRRRAPDGSEILAGRAALHIIWADLAEARTVATSPDYRGRGVGKALIRQSLADAVEIGVNRVFCLTFETGFFGSLGFEPIKGIPVSPEVYVELLHSADEGVAEFLDLARVKPNTLGNTRMIKYL